MIEILLATFNGEKFLWQQLQSIKNQTCSDWKIIAGDDGSTDGTIAILREFERQNPGRIEIHLNNCKSCGRLQAAAGEVFEANVSRVADGLHEANAQKLVASRLKSGQVERQGKKQGRKNRAGNGAGRLNHGAVGNFARLMRFSAAKYVAFCDQDDVWVSTKLEKSLNTLRQVESSFGEVPVLVHTDLAIVDENLKQLYSSMVKAQNLNCEANCVRQVIVQNCVTGCSMMANRALIKMVGFVPNGVIMHDWWLAIVATAFGRLQFVNEPLVLYRQHATNEIGAKVVGFGGGPKWGGKVLRFWFCSLVFVFKKLFSAKKTRRFVWQTFEQSRVFLRTYRRCLSFGQKKVLHDYFSIGTGNKFVRVRRLVAGGFLKHGLLRKIWQFIYI